MKRPKPDIHVVYDGHFDQCRSSGMFGGANRVLLHVVKTAAMHMPQLAKHAALGRSRIFRRLQAVVECYEIERLANPRDRHHYMQPAQREIQPVNNKTLHETSPLRILLSTHRTDAG